MPTTQTSSSADSIYEKAQYNAMVKMVKSNEHVILAEAIDAFPNQLLEGLYDAMQNMRQMKKDQKRALLLAAIDIFPKELLIALVSTEAGDEWVENLVRARFPLALHKQMSHEIGVLEGTIKEPKEAATTKKSTPPAQEDSDSWADATDEENGAPSASEAEDEQKTWNKVVKPLSKAALSKKAAAAAEAQAKKDAEEEANADLPSAEDMEALGEHIKSNLMGQASIEINGKKSYIKVSPQVTGRGRMIVRLSRGNQDRVDVVHRLTIRSLAKGTTVFEVLRGEKGGVAVYSKSIDTDKVHTELEDLNALLKYIWETYYPRSKAASPKK
jgi:hypothetical protein